MIHDVLIKQDIVLKIKFIPTMIELRRSLLIYLLDLISI